MALPQYAAERVLDNLKVTSPADLMALDSIAWERGALVLYRDLRGAEARLVILGKKAIITISSAVEDSRRRRFSVAHELGHLELHRRRSNVLLCSSEDIDDWGKRETDTNLEREANSFAAALLLPDRFFTSQCRGKEPSLELVSELAHAFDVSLTATAIRYLQFCEEPCAVVFSKDGYMKWYQASQAFKELGFFIPAPGPLDAASTAGRFFRGYAIREISRRIAAEYWFEPGLYQSGATILEQSWAMPGYNAVLTLLWVDQDIEDEDDRWSDED